MRQKKILLDIATIQRLEWLAEEDECTISAFCIGEIRSKKVFMMGEDNRLRYPIEKDHFPYIHPKHAIYQEVVLHLGIMAEQELKALAKRYEFSEGEVIAWITRLCDKEYHDTGRGHRSPCDYPNCFVKTYDEARFFN